MRPADRTRLTTALREHVARIAANLRSKLRQPGPARERAQKLWTDEQVGEDFDVWTNLLSRRAAVLWVLKSVYVRVLEDKGLLRPGRLLDPESQQLFEKLAPNLGESAFLRWVYRDLASPHGGLPELFAPQPAEVATPSDEDSRTLIEFWRHRDADSGALWSFAEERFEGELMGDLYQELDPVVKDRFALCQTPDFVRAFILDRTLTPAIETFGADTVRLLDPACGSGHFLIDGLKRLVTATTAKHEDWERKELVRHCLDRVVGIDLNDYACTLARARLVMTAAELAGVSSLAEGSAFHPHVYWADGLEQVEKGQDARGHQPSLLDPTQNEAHRASLTRTEVRTALGKVLEPKFHAVVANPPYIAEKDEARREYHREKVGKNRRYISAYKEYSLGSPFVERCFQLGMKDGFIGLITANNFMKRDFGKPLIEEVLAKRELSLVVDTSQAYIPFHGTPTVLLFCRNREASSNTIRAVLSKRGELGTPEDPSKGHVWQGIVSSWNRVGFENQYISVDDLPRQELASHPWTLQGGGATSLKRLIESRAHSKLRDISSDVGAAVMTRADEVYLSSPGSLASRFASGEDRPFVTGKQVRDWSVAADMTVLYPYGEDREIPSSPSMERWLWPYRTRLWLRREPNGNHREVGLKWWEWSRYISRRHTAELQIVFSNVASHNHFALVREQLLFGSHAPCIRLHPAATETDYLALLALLNSSTACFWMKQIFYPKGTATRDTMVPENNRHEFAVTGMLDFPIPPLEKSAVIVRFSQLLDKRICAQQELTPARILTVSEYQSATELRHSLHGAEVKSGQLFRQMVFLQEEMDWAIYRLYGIDAGPVEETTVYEITPEQRPFAWTSPEAADALPIAIRNLYEQRRDAIERDPSLRLIETPVFKRLWRGASGEGGRYGETYEEKARQAIFAWLCDRIESVLKGRGRPCTLAHIVGAVQDDKRMMAAATVYKDRQDFDLGGLVTEILNSESVANHPFHIYTESGLTKRAAWEQTWALQRREDAGEKIDNIPVPPEYSQGSRGKVTDFLRSEYWQLRGSLDVPKERFIAFTEVPGRDPSQTLYGWAGWTPLQRLKALLSIDEELEDAGVPLADRIGVLDSAWRLLPDVAREAVATANRLKAELQALVGTDGPSREQLEQWRQRFPPPGTKAARAAGQSAKKKKS